MEEAARLQKLLRRCEVKGSAKRRQRKQERKKHRTRKHVENLMVRMSLGDDSAFMAMAKLDKRDHEAVMEAAVEIGGEIRSEIRRGRA